MSRTDAVTRILFEAFAPAEVRLFYVIGYAAIAVFCYGVYVQVRKYRRGAAAAARRRPAGRASATWSRRCCSHRTIARRDRRPGGAHRLIFYGFVLLFLGTATITLEYDILGPLFGMHFWHGKFYLWFSLVLDVAGVALIGGLALHDVSARLAASRRSSITRARTARRAIRISTGRTTGAKTGPFCGRC